MVEPSSCEINEFRGLQLHKARPYKTATCPQQTKPDNLGGGLLDFVAYNAWEWCWWRKALK
jgi:hypothetical protein